MKYYGILNYLKGTVMLSEMDLTLHGINRKSVNKERDAEIFSKIDASPHPVKHLKKYRATISKSAIISFCGIFLLHAVAYKGAKNKFRSCTR
jgi:hypothetical protein